MKKIVIRSLLLMLMMFPSGILLAQDSQFHILPESTTSGDKLNETIKTIGQTGGVVMDQYVTQADKLSWSVADQLATGVMNRDTLLNYMVYIVKFLSQLGMFIGAIMLIYAGYQYATQVFWGKVDNAKNAIKYAFIGILVITFSYAIMKVFTAMFLGT